MNGEGSPLWAPYLGEDPSQSGSISSGEFRDVIGSGSAPYIHFFPRQANGYPYPAAYALNWIKSGTWNPNVNRLRFQFKCGNAITRNSSGAAVFEVGTYIRSHSNSDLAFQGDHFYHQLSPNIYANHWMLFELNRVPQHQVGKDPGTNWPEDPDAPTHYFDGLTRWYIDAIGGNGNWSNQTCSLRQVVFDTESGEPDSQVSSIVATYTGSAYEVTWAAPKNTTMTFEVRYSTSSMKSAGIAAGTSGGTVSSPGNTYTGTIWKSPAMAAAATLYVAIRPTSGTAFTEIAIPNMDGGTVTPPPPPAPPPVTSACDANGDGIVSSADIASALNSLLGAASCKVDLDANGVCNIVDLQRVVNASLGQACRTGI